MVYSSSSILNFLCILLFSFTFTTSAQVQSARCPYNYLYNFGDGVTDTGNAIARPLGFLLPANRPPYGKTFPGVPTGRWSDGRVDIDYAAQYQGFPNVAPYLSLNNVTAANAITFAVARSPVLDRLFFTTKRVVIPSFAASLNIQMSWFKKYLNTIFSTATDIANRLANSILIFGDIEGNDITYPLTQGKSIQEVMGYSAQVTNAQISAARELIRMGATRIVITGNAPMGCFPFILTELRSNNPADYDDLGCLKSVNNLIMLKNIGLQRALDNLRLEFPNILILYVDFYGPELSLIREMVSGSNRNSALKACCGIGGNYNYNKLRFCGSPGVPDCPDPNNYFFWDGIHVTQEAINRTLAIFAQAALGALGCTSF